MNTSDTPTDPQELRGEIAQTRADLGDTVEALAAKTDVKARAKHAAGEAAGQAKQKLADATDRAAQAAGSVKDRLDHQLPPQVRRPLPWAALGAGAAVIGLVVFLIRRRRA